ncbi:MAG TPA: beta-ketoacyl synthase N-terminal-like domain-containing protein, partial [Tepidisphaeraceae bacterium]|nr:beta-ketoacyl synthase N-terminal-like domain-containing protein [Tepidisphaeraceae bacterium]
MQTLSRTALAKGRAVVAKPGESAIEVVGCGRPLPGLSIAIVAPESQKALAAGQIGEIWLHSAQMARGYYHNPEATREAFTARLSAPAFGLPEGPYFRTGDLGFLDEQQVLYITGRCKDVIIIDGVNHYPNDIEHTVEQCHPDIVPSGVAAFSYDDDKGEQLGIWVEVTTDTDPEGVIHNTLHAVSEHHELGVACIQLLRRGTIPKTSSGKIQRHACRDAFCEGQVAPLHEWRRKEEPQPEALPQEQRAVEERLRHLLASRLGISPESIDAREPVASYGLSSRQAVALAVELEDLFGVSLPVTLFWRFPSIRAVAAFLTREQCGETPTAPAVAPTNHVPIAIIGMAARLPGTDTLDDFWRLLQNGREAIRRIPSDRWDAESVYHPEPGQKGKTYTLHGGFLDSVDRFDAAFFGLSGREAAQMDPQQRLLLEVTWEALEDAHCPADRLDGTDTGVFIGASHTDFARRLLSNPDLIDVHTGAGATLSIIANRISYWLGLHGPSMTIDTACSSAMVAIHQACQSLRNQECGLAIAGGVNLILAPEATIALSQAHMLSPDGRCKAFADNADGYGRGEGCGVILLKRLDDALADGDPVLGIVQGTALAQDGRSNGLTAPSEIGQALVIRRALADAHLLPDDLLFIEAHGTGTKLGDPIEVAALREVFGKTRPQDLPLWIGSVKSNIGHLEAAAGIAGILKVLLAFRHHLLPATLHARRLNPALMLDGTPLRIATEPVPLPEGVPCYAGVSSFGFGGTLSHIILAAPPTRQQSEAPASRPLLLVLSARTQAALHDLAQRYRDFLATTEDEPGTICAAAATGQMHFEHRLAITGDSREDLIRRLDSYLT